MSPPGGIVAAGRRVTWGLADQVLSSATNFALTVLVARVATGREFGAFAIVMATYLVLTGLGQGLAGQPFAVRHSAPAAAADATAGVAVSGAAGAALVLGVLLGAGCVALGAGSVASGERAGRELGGLLIVLGVALPGLLLQDAWRFLFVALGRPRAAAANDLAWAIAQGAGLAAVTVTGHAGALAFTAAWAAAGCAAAAYGATQAGRLPGLAASRAWVRAERDLATGFMAQALVIRGAAQLLYTAIAVVAGLGAAGAVRGAQVVFAPLTLMYQGLLLAAVPEGVRALRTSRRRLAAVVRVVSVVAVGPAVAWSVLVLLLPDRFGHELLGATWSGARPLLPAAAVQVAAVAASLGAQVGIRALGASGRGLRVDGALAAVLLAAGAAGARLAGAAGAAAGIAAATAGGVAVWWIALETAPPAGAGAPASAGVSPRRAPR